jgi:deoxyribodipyrimidine photo-lyase
VSNAVPVTLVWFRNDLRGGDNPALQGAVARGGVVIPVYVHAPDEEQPWTPGGASRWWSHQSLQSLGATLESLQSRLIIRTGNSLQQLKALVTETGADAVFWNRRYEPVVTARDAGIKTELRALELTVESFNGALLHEPWTIQNQSGKPFQVFTPFWKHCLSKPDPAAPLPAPKKLTSPSRWPKSESLVELELEPKINWANGMKAVWQPGEAGAKKQLKRFLDAAFVDYSDKRNRPDLLGTSRLSPHLHFGEISPRQVWHAVRRHAEEHKFGSWRTSQYLTEVGWREFAHHLLHHFPHTPTEPLREDFKRFPWRKDAEFLRAWQKGQTGYPIVDAGMRELWTTGWMHNRVRMIVASFLVKDLLLSWREGAAWFWDTLVDADLAQNTLGWQWTAGCGADAAPYFRVFNPRSQGEKFDPRGNYVRKWCPELARLPDEYLHQPDNAPPEILARAGVVMGENYPAPVVNHAIAREVALEAFAKLKGK